MFKKIRNNIAALASALLLLAVPVAMPAAVFADATDTGQCATQGSNLDLTSVSSDTCTGADVSGGATGLTNLIKLVINIFSVIVGAVAVIMIIVGGFRYITSGGDSNNVSGAKNTIIYAIIGLVIVAIAQFVVQFVLNKLGNGQ